MYANFIPTLRGEAPVTHFAEPYFRAEIEATDHSLINYIPCKDCIASAGVDYKTIYGFDAIGFHNWNTTASGSLTKDIVLPESGEYRIYMRVVKHPKIYNPKVTLELDSVDVDEKDCGSDALRLVMLDFGKHTLSSGTHTLKAKWTSRDTWVESFIVKKVITLSTDDTNPELSLEAKTASYSKNNIAELNTAKMNVIFKEDFFLESNPYSRMIFDFMDSVTFYVGETRKKAKPDFGGYLLGYTQNPDNNTISFDFVDRLIDMYREPTYMNYSLGIGPSDDEKSVFPHYNFNNILQFLDFQCANNEYPIMTEVKASYAFLLNMGDVSDYNSIACSGYAKKHDKNIGNPAPSLMLSYNDVKIKTCSEVQSLACDSIWWASIGNPKDAAENPLLVFDYLAVGSGTVYPLRGNVVVEMFKDGQQPSDAQEYTITFNSSRVEGTVIGHSPPQYTGIPVAFKFNLKEAFDKICPSSHYYITKVSFVDELNEWNSSNLKDRVLYVDNIGLMAEETNMQLHLDMGTNYPIEVVRKVCEESGYAGYVKYGKERCKDVFVMEKLYGNPGEVEAKQGFNILKISNITYKPSVGKGSSGFANKALRHWHYKEGANDAVGSSSYMNMDSYLRYGPWQNYKDLSDVNTQVDADKDAKEYIETNSYAYVGFSLDIMGTVLLNPSNYLVTDLPQQYLSGYHNIKSMDNSFNLESQEFQTTIDLNLPSKRFNSAILNIKRQLLGYDNSNSRSMYSQTSLGTMGFRSPGAFIQKR